MAKHELELEAVNSLIEASVELSREGRRSVHLDVMDGWNWGSARCIIDLTPTEAKKLGEDLILLAEEAMSV